MHGLFFDIGLGLGLASAGVIRPFLPALLAGALASAKALGVSFADHPWHFLQAGWWLLVVAVALVAAYALQLLVGLAPTPSSPAERRGAEPLAAALTGLAVGSGAVLFAGTLCAHGERWWPGLLGGLAVAAVTQWAINPLIARARGRLPDRGAREALTVYLDAAALLLAALVCVLHPLGYLAVLLVGWFAWRGRGRGDGKYAGLRILGR